MRQALSDLRVVEIGSGFAAGWCGKVFADLGADVIKVEPLAGDELRTDPGLFAHLNTNKRSVLLDVSPTAGPALRELLAGADLVVETPGRRSLLDWGIDRDQIVSADPATSVVAITGFGSKGPYADYSWSDVVVQAFSGALLNDRKGPVKLPLSIEQAVVGQAAALGGLAAVLRARATRLAAFVDVSAVEVLASTPNRIARYLGWEYLGRQATGQVATTPTDTLLPLGIFPCADGFVAMMMTPQQLNEMLTVLGSDELRAAFAAPDAFTNPITKEILDGVLYPWLLSRTRDEVTVAAQAAGWPVTPVNEPEAMLQADHLFQRGFWVHAVDQELGPLVLPGAPYRFTEGGWSLRRPAPLAGQHEPVDEVQPDAPTFTATDPNMPPLTGIRVLDITTVWSGPFVTQNLADLGAEVIRVETPLVFPPTTKGYVPRPTSTMSLGALGMLYAPLAPGQSDRPFNRHSMNNSVGRGKLSCTLDVRLPRQRELFMQLVAKSDVFIENLKASTLHQMGIHETELLKINPRLIVMRIPPAGLSGDWSHYTGFGAQFDGLTGLAALSGHRGTNFMESPSTLHMDSATGPAGAFALLAALHYRAATGRGQVIEMAQSENVLSQLGEVFVNLQRGVATVRQGNRDLYCAPQGVYPCAEGGWLALTVTDDAAWAGLTKVMDRPDLADDPRFADVAGRQAAHDELDVAIAEWTKDVLASQVFHVLQHAGVAAAPIADDPMFADDAQFKARGWIRPLESRDVGTFSHLGPMFQGLPLAWERGAPTLGQDNRYVFQEVLGLDDAAYEALVADGIAIEDYLNKDGVPY